MQHRISFSADLKIALLAGKRKFRKSGYGKKVTAMKVENIFNHHPFTVNANGKLWLQKERADVIY